jgi:hypothetical protein
MKNINENTIIKVKDDNAILMSPTYRYSTASVKCVEFWYHAYGKGIGNLNVYKLEKAGVSGNPQLIYSISGDQGNEW